MDLLAWLEEHELPFFGLTLALVVLLTIGGM